MTSAKSSLQEPIHPLSMDTTSTHNISMPPIAPNSYWSHTILGELVFSREVSSQPLWCTSVVTALEEETQWDQKKFKASLGY